MVIKAGSLARLAMLLAAAEYSDDEVLTLVRALHAADASELQQRVRAYRGLLREERARVGTTHATTPALVGAEPEEQVQTGDRSAGQKRDVSQGPFTDEVAAQVERLLIVESNLSKVKAAELLARALAMRFPGERIARFSSREGFGRWIRQLAKTINPSEIIHLAAVIRNSRVHALGDDWISKP